MGCDLIIISYPLGGGGGQTLRGKFQHQASDFLEHLDAQLSIIGQIFLKNKSLGSKPQIWSKRLISSLILTKFEGKQAESELCQAQLSLVS